VERLLAGGASLVANLGYGRGHSVKEVVDAVRRGHRPAAAHAHRPAPPGRSAATLRERPTGRGPSCTGPRASTDLDTMVAHAWADAARLIVLGSGTAVPRADRASSCYLVDDGAGHVLLVDLGPGALHRAAAAGCALPDIDAVLLTHVHPDHCADLVALQFALRNPNVAPGRSLSSSRATRRCSCSSRGCAMRGPVASRPHPAACSCCR